MHFSTSNAVVLLVAVSCSHGLLNIPMGRSYEDGVELFINVTVGGHTVAVQVDSGSSTFAIPVIQVTGGLSFCANDSLICMLSSFQSHPLLMAVQYSSRVRLWIIHTIWQQFKTGRKLQHVCVSQLHFGQQLFFT